MEDQNKNLIYPKSECGFIWKILEQDERMVSAISQKLEINNIVSRILFNRGIRSIEEAEKFLNGSLREDLPDPFLLKDMDKGVSRILRAIIKKEKITVFADYDVDGATSAALLYKFFKQLGIIVDIYVPNRLTEGYGPNVGAMRKIRETGTELLITVDCGTSAHEAITEANELGMDVIVIDHHLASGELPEAYAIVNPNQIDDDFPFKSIAAVAVAFLTIIAIRNKLKSINWFDDNNVDDIDLMLFLDLVALGTVCDVMPLNGINRIFVKHGMKLIARRNNLGIATIMDIAKIKGVPRAHHLGFVVGPRINAGGRVDESRLGAALLISDDIARCYEIADRLEELNKERRNLENIALEEALLYVQQNFVVDNAVIFAIGQNWHIGILGILASRIKERYNKPSIIISVSEGVGKGSARSVPGINMGGLISNAKAQGILTEGGGHAMAGGFSIKEENIPLFIDYTLSQLQQQSELDMIIERASEISIDSIIAISAANISLLNSLEKLAPFGNHNPSPKFAIYNAKLLQVSIFSGEHLLLSVQDNIYYNSKDILKCVFFRAHNKKIGQLLIQSQGRYVNLIGTLQENIVDKRGVQFIIEDVIIHDEQQAE